jgi:hypothetical protein
MQNSLEQATEPQGHPAAPYEYGAASHEAHEEPHRHRSLHAIYNAFLAFESARQAIEVLVDDRKTREQYVLTILQAELPAYFLLYHEYRKVENDVRSKRILPRLPKYRVLIKSIADATSLDEASRALAERVRELWDECVCGEEIRFPEKFVTPAIEPGMARVDRKTYLWGHADRQPPPEAR